MNTNTKKQAVTFEQAATTGIRVDGIATKILVYTDQAMVWNKDRNRREACEVDVMELTVNGKTFMLKGKAVATAIERGVTVNVMVRVVGERKAQIRYGQDSRHAPVHAVTRYNYNAPIKAIGAWRIRA